MNRFTYGFDLRIGRAYLLVLAFAFLAVTILGCGPGGISIVPLGAKLQNADTAFDQAEAMTVQDDDPEKMEANRAEQRDLYDKAMSLYTEVIQRDTKGKYAQRAYYQIARIYKRRYDWDKAVENYQAIVDLDPHRILRE